VSDVSILSIIADEHCAVCFCFIFFKKHYGQAQRVIEGGNM